MKIEPGQVAVITGGASGIGFGLAEALVSRGVSVVLSEIRAEALHDAAASLAPASEVLTVVMDVTDASALDRLAEETLDQFGPVLRSLDANPIATRRPAAHRIENMA